MASYTFNTRNIQLCLVLVLAVAVLVCIAYGANGVRGTDQYNYLEDVRTLQSGQPPITNLIFPAKLLREGSNPLPPYFHHNTPALHIAAYLSNVVDSYAAWIVMNVLCHLIVAISIWLVAIKYADSRIAIWTSMLYLVSPIAIWQSINVLQEMYFSALVAIAVVGFAYRNSLPATLSGGLALLLGILSHPIYFIPALYFGFYMLASSAKHSRYILCSVSVLFLVMAVYLQGYTKFLFPSSFQPNLAAIVASAIPGESNMYWHYSIEQREVNAELLIMKLVAAAKRHFFVLQEMPFFIFTNIAVLALVYLLVRHFRSSWKLLLPLLILMGLYASMIVLQQNQPRYQQIVASCTFSLLAIAWFRSGLKLSSSVLGVVLLCCVAVDIYVVSLARVEAKYSSEQLGELRQILDSNVVSDSKIVALDIGPHSPLAVTVKPRILLSIRTEMMDLSSIQLALERFAPTHLLAHEEADVGDLGLELETVVKIPEGFYKSLQVYKIISKE